MELPFDMEQTMQPVYSSCEGWKQNVEGIDKFEDLPENMRQYISKLEEKTGLPIVLVSTSPNRKDTIIRTEI
jgi:adenylosuccinate synthase